MNHVTGRFNASSQRRTIFWSAILVGLLSTSLASVTQAATPKLLEVVKSGEKYQGKLAAKSSNVCWLMSRDGRLSIFKIKQIDSVHTVSPRFREYSLAELRDQLRREMPKHFKVEGTAHFLVCAEKKNRKFGEICEETYRTFHRYFSVRGFKITEPEFPLVMIVFPERESFVAYCRKDGINPPPGMLGYYMRLTNRIALFDVGENIGTATSTRSESPSPASFFARGQDDWFRLPLRDQFASASGSDRFDAVVEANLYNTIVHETTHQVAFNTGLHSRIGPTPKWVIEGLATMFEAPGIRDSRKSASPNSRINRSRFQWFGNYLKSRRKPDSLADFVSTDDLYSSATLDAYSEGWALTFFLAETRHGSYARYLKAIAQRDPLKPYPAEERLKEFTKAFGAIKPLEANFLRFFESLK